MVRGYRSAVRDESARATRRRILDAARALLVTGGYQACSVAALADAAGVSPQTVYNAVGSKAAVLKACYDVTIAGDDEPVAMSDRPQFRAVREATSREDFVRAYAGWLRFLQGRVGDLLGAVLRPGEATDAGVAEFAATIDRERRIGTTHALTAYADRFGLGADLTLERAVDAVWTLNSPEVFDRLVRRCGWSLDQYESWLVAQLTAALGR